MYRVIHLYIGQGPTVAPILKNKMTVMLTTNQDQDKLIVLQSVILNPVNIF